MRGLFIYLLSVAVIVSAVLMAAIFLGSVPTAETFAQTTSLSKIERVKAAAGTPYVAHGSLSPIYPATPGKELLGKPVQTVMHVTSSRKIELPKSVFKPVGSKPFDVGQELRTPTLPRQIYTVADRDKEYSQQALGYAQEPPPRSHVLDISAHGLY